MNHLDNGVDVLDAIDHMLDDFLRRQHLERVVLFLLATIPGVVDVHVHGKVIVSAGNISGIVLIEAFVVGIHL